VTQQNKNDIEKEPKRKSVDICFSSKHKTEKKNSEKSFYFRKYLFICFKYLHLNQDKANGKDFDQWQRRWSVFKLG
jgi:hypothetical protein